MKSSLHEKSHPKVYAHLVLEVIFTFFPIHFYCFPEWKLHRLRSQRAFWKSATFRFQPQPQLIDKGGSNKTVASCRLQFPLLFPVETNTGQIERAIIGGLLCLSWSSVSSIFIENRSRESRGDVSPCHFQLWLMAESWLQVLAFQTSYWNLCSFYF